MVSHIGIYIWIYIYIYIYIYLVKLAHQWAIGLVNMQNIAKGAQICSRFTIHSTILFSAIHNGDTPP